MARITKREYEERQSAFLQALGRELAVEMAERKIAPFRKGESGDVIESDVMDVFGPAFKRAQASLPDESDRWSDFEGEVLDDVWSYLEDGPVVYGDTNDEVGMSLGPAGDWYVNVHSWTCPPYAYLFSDEENMGWALLAVADPFDDEAVLAAALADVLKYASWAEWREYWPAEDLEGDDSGEASPGGPD